MGSFFLSISATVLLVADLSGVPDALLLRHLNQVVHRLPTVLTAVGLFLLAAGYGIDVDERANSYSLDDGTAALCYFGVVLAPLFPLTLCVFALMLRWRRAALNSTSDEMLRLGCRWVTTWADRIPRVPRDGSSASGGGDAAARQTSSRGRHSFQTVLAFLEEPVVV